MKRCERKVERKVDYPRNVYFFRAPNKPGVGQDMFYCWDCANVKWKDLDNMIGSGLTTLESFGHPNGQHCTPFSSIPVHPYKLLDKDYIIHWCATHLKGTDSLRRKYPVHDKMGNAGWFVDVEKSWVEGGLNAQTIKDLVTILK